MVTQIAMVKDESIVINLMLGHPNLLLQLLLVTYRTAIYFIFTHRNKIYSIKEYSSRIELANGADIFLFGFYLDAYIY